MACRTQRVGNATILAAIGLGSRGGRFPFGGVAQLVERHVRNVEVGGSSPLTSTRNAQVTGLVAKGIVTHQ